MARCRVTYLEAADARPVRAGATTLVDLDADPVPERPAWVGRPGAAPVRTPPAPPRPRRIPWFAGAAALVVAALVAPLLTGDGGEPEAAPDPGVTPAVEVTPGPVPIATASVLAEPWRGVFEHHPDSRAPVSVPRVHLVVMEGDEARAVLVVDATRRAFSGAEHGSTDPDQTRVLGAVAGRGLRTVQWDDGGYGLSLTSTGLTRADQEAVAAAVVLPPGPSLQHGRAPGFDDVALAGLGLAVTERRSGSGTTLGSPLIGQVGGGSIEGQLHRSGVDPVLVSIVQDQLVTASRLRRALGEGVAVDLTDLPGVSAAAALDHGIALRAERRIRGWARLVLDHEAGVTIELSSDVVGPEALADVARAMDLGRLARTAAPGGGG